MKNANEFALMCDMACNACQKIADIVGYEFENAINEEKEFAHNKIHLFANKYTSVSEEDLIAEYDKIILTITKDQFDNRKTQDFAVDSFDGKTCVIANPVDHLGIFLITTLDKETCKLEAEIKYLSHDEWIRINNLGPNVQYIFESDGSVATIPWSFNDNKNCTGICKVTCNHGKVDIWFSKRQQEILRTIDKFWSDNPLFKDEGHPDIPRSIHWLMTWSKYVLCDSNEWSQWDMLAMAIKRIETLVNNTSADSFSGMKEEW